MCARVCLRQTRSLYNMWKVQTTIDCWQTKGRSHMWTVFRWGVDIHALRQTTIGKTILCLPGPIPVWHQHMSHPLCSCILWFIVRQFVFSIHRNASPNGGSRIMYTYKMLLFFGKAHSYSFSFELLRKWFLELIICQVYWEYVSISCLTCHMRRCDLTTCLPVCR